MANTSEQQSRAGRRQFRGFVRLFVPERVRRVMRVGTYVAVLFVVLAGVAANSAMGSVTEQALITGRQLSKLEDFTSSSSRLVLNGERMNIASATTTADVSAVLDRVEGVCKEDGTVARDFREIDSLMTDAKALAAAKKFRMGVLREERDGEGIVACAVRNPKNGDQNFVKGLMKFADSFDLADVGLLRYVYARRTDSGRTHVITVWTDGSFKFDSMLAPADGKDAPGSDPRNAPRPKDRTLLDGGGGRRSPLGSNLRIHRALEGRAPAVRLGNAQAWLESRAGERRGAGGALLQPQGRGPDAGGVPQRGPYGSVHARNARQLSRTSDVPISALSGHTGSRV